MSKPVQRPEWLDQKRERLTQLLDRTKTAIQQVTDENIKALLAAEISTLTEVLQLVKQLGLDSKKLQETVNLLQAQLIIK